MRKPLPPMEVLHRKLYLDSEGVARWRSQPGKSARNDRAGQTIGTVVDTVRGGKRCKVGILKRTYYRARIVYALAHGIDPGDLCVDHINGNTTDDRASNLRLATPSQNGAYRLKAVPNKLGYRNVTIQKNGTYCVVVKRKHIGLYPDLETAVRVAKEVRERLYGEFAGMA